MHEGMLNLYDLTNLKNPDKGTKPYLEFLRKVVLLLQLVEAFVLNTIWPKELGFFNEAALKGDLGNLILRPLGLRGKKKP